MREPTIDPIPGKGPAGQTSGAPPAACLPDYYYGAATLNRPPEITAETLYVIGGLYGNPEALAEVLAMKAREDRGGSAVHSPVRLVFNGDFNWFNVDAESFLKINEAVLEHVAIQGNVEAELARQGAALDCGCDYPSYVDPDTVKRSHRIFARLKKTASHASGIVSPNWLCSLWPYISVSRCHSLSHTLSWYFTASFSLSLFVDSLDPIDD